MAADALIEMRGLARTYGSGPSAVHALRPLDLDLPAGQFIAVMGPSGSGKSTILNLLGLLDQPTAGDYRLEGISVAQLDDDARSQVRCRRIGFIFQSFNLLPHFNVLENVAVPLEYADMPRREMMARSRDLLDRVGLGDRLHHRPTELSGGQCQRVAIARALANDPAILLADEPTGNLDERTGEEVLQLFHDLHAQGRTVIMVTHNPEYRSVVERVITLHDGRVTEDRVQ